MTAGLIALAYTLPQSVDARANPVVALGLMAAMCAAYVLLLRAFHPRVVAVSRAGVVSLLRSQRVAA